MPIGRHKKENECLFIDELTKIKKQLPESRSLTEQSCKIGGKMTVKKILATLVLSLGVFASSANADLCAVMYEHDNYSGASMVVSGANSHNGFIGSWWNDRVTSVTLEPGCSITLFEHANFGGASYTLSGSSGNLGSLWNDQISSYKCDC